jgi:hypothetical protein
MPMIEISGDAGSDPRPAAVTFVSGGLVAEAGAAT